MTKKRDHAARHAEHMERIRALHRRSELERIEKKLAEHEWLRRQRLLTEDERCVGEYLRERQAELRSLLGVAPADAAEPVVDRNARRRARRARRRAQA